MCDVKSIITKWNLLIDSLKTDKLNKDFFTDVVKETYYYYKNVHKKMNTDESCVFTTNEKELFKIIFSYSHLDDPASSEIQRLYSATQIVATCLMGVCDIGDYRADPFLKTCVFSAKGNAEFNYNVDTGDLSNIMENLHYLW